MGSGKIILLNGVSSVGKSTLAKALQRTLQAPYFYIAQDIFTHMMAPNYMGKYLADDRLNPIWKQAVSAMHHTIRLYSDLGNNVIVDHVMTEWSDENDADESFCELKKLLEGYAVYWIQVTCPLEELRRREIERGDRALGAAEWQLGYLTPKTGYDLTVDTYENTIEECVIKIAQIVGERIHSPAISKPIAP